MTQATSERHDIPYSVIIGWGLGTLPMAIFFNSFNILALRFFTDYVGLAAGTAGAIIGFSKLYDAVSDPVMGVISDRTRSPFGRRRPYLLLGGVLCAIAIALIYAIPAGLEGVSAIWIVILAVLFYATAYTIYNVPYIAMSSEISANSGTRSLMMSWRVVSIGAGGLIAGAFGPKIVEWSGGGADGHRTMGLVLGVAIMAFAFLSFNLTGRTQPAASPQNRLKTTFIERVRTVLSNTPFLYLLGLKFFQLAGVAMSSATLAFFTVWILGRGYGDLGTIVLFTTLGQIAGTPVWLRFSRRYGKKAAFFLSAFLFAAVSLTWLFATADEAFWLTNLRVLLKGLATGGILLIGQALLPDTIEYDRLRTGMRREGVLSGVYTTIEKISFAIGATVSGVYLGAMNYVPGLQPGVDQQPSEALIAIYYCQSVVPAVAVGLAAMCMWRIDLSDEKLAELRASAAQAAAS